jgi:hypothetical protein
VFRGPERDLNGPYLTFLGGTAFYGKYVLDAIPDQVEDWTGLACVNLGLLNGGVDAMCRPEVIALANRGRATVIEVVGAQNLCNQFYRVHPERNDRLVAVTRLFRQVFPEIDLSEVHFTRHLLHQIQVAAPNRYETVVEELRSAWVEGMMGLLRALSGPKILLWVMPAVELRDGARAALGSDPLFVDMAAVQTLSGFVDAVVEVRETPEIVALGHAGMIVPETCAQVAQALPRGALLAEAAMALLDPLHALGIGPGRQKPGPRRAGGTEPV